LVAVDGVILVALDLIEMIGIDQPMAIVFYMLKLVVLGDKVTIMPDPLKAVVLDADVLIFL
jgi:hypothetical protein